jgi:hypothetical protein
MISTFNYAFITHPIYRAHPDAKKVPAFLRMTFMLIDYSYSRHDIWREQ